MCYDLCTNLTCSNEHVMEWTVMVSASVWELHNCWWSSSDLASPSEPTLALPGLKSYFFLGRSQFRFQNTTGFSCFTGMLKLSICRTLLIR